MESNNPFWSTVSGYLHPSVDGTLLKAELSLHEAGLCSHCIQGSRGAGGKMHQNLVSKTYHSFRFGLRTGLHLWILCLFVCKADRQHIGSKLSGHLQASREVKCTSPRAVVISGNTARIDQLEPWWTGISDTAKSPLWASTGMVQIMHRSLFNPAPEHNI